VSRIDLARFTDACDYPGTIHAAAVERHLQTYLDALGVKRRIQQLPRGWRIEDHAALSEYVNGILDDIVKRNPGIRASAARDARAARAARAASDARDARAANDARAASAANDANDALDAIAGGLQRFAAWCIQTHSWSYWRFDLSWNSCTAFGARQLRAQKVSAWAEPLLEAFISGCWMLHWTEDTLYWIAKPTLHKESIPGGQRLHNEKYAAFESDVENIYFWHGVLVPAFVVVRPDWITLKYIQEEKNAEVRRVMIERYGESRYIANSDMEPVAKDKIFGDLYVETLEAGRPIAKLHVINRSPEPDGSFKRYWLPINPAHYDGDAGRIPQAASASTWRTTPGGRELFFEKWQDYRPAIET